MGKEDPDLVAGQAVRAMVRGRSSVIGARVISVPAAGLITVLPQAARTRLQAVLSQPSRRRRGGTRRAQPSPGHRVQWRTLEFMPSAVLLPPDDIGLTVELLR